MADRGLTARELAKSAVGLAVELSERLREVEERLRAVEDRLHALEAEHQVTTVRMGELQRDLDVLKGKRSG